MAKNELLHISLLDNTASILLSSKKGKGMSIDHKKEIIFPHSVMDEGKIIDTEAFSSQLREELKKAKIKKKKVSIMLPHSQFLFVQVPWNKKKSPSKKEARKHILHFFPKKEILINYGFEFDFYKDGQTILYRFLKQNSYRNIDLTMRKASLRVEEYRSQLFVFPRFISKIEEEDNYALFILGKKKSKFLHIKNSLIHSEKIFSFSYAKVKEIYKRRIADESRREDLYESYGILEGVDREYIKRDISKILEPLNRFFFEYPIREPVYLISEEKMLKGFPSFLRRVGKTEIKEFCVFDHLKREKVDNVMTLNRNRDRSFAPLVADAYLKYFS